MSESLEDTILKLFYHAESLAAVRRTLSKILDGVRGTSDEPLIILAIKELDLVRTTLLYEYELLDTSNIISEEYMQSYYARRVEILRMTTGQIQGQQSVFHDKTSHVDCKRAKEAIGDGGDIMVSAVQDLNWAIDRLEQTIIKGKRNRTTH